MYKPDQSKQIKATTTTTSIGPRLPAASPVLGGTEGYTTPVPVGAATEVLFTVAYGAAELVTIGGTEEL